MARRQPSLLSRDITCRCSQFNLNDVGLDVLLSKDGSRWFVLMMAIAKGNMASTAFNTMMDKLNAQKDDVGISVEEGRMVNDLHDRKFTKEELDRMKEGFEEFFRQYL